MCRRDAEANTRDACAPPDYREGRRILILMPAQPERFLAVRLIFRYCSPAMSMNLGGRRRREAHENYDAIATGIHADGVDVKIGFPVVNGPNVAGLIDA